MRDDIAELGRIRLAEDLSFEAMAAEVGIPYATLRRILTTPQPVLFERTRYKIRQYLERRRAGRPRQRDAS